MRIGVDIFGGDFCPQVPLEGVLAYLAQPLPGVVPVLIGDRDRIAAELESRGHAPENFEILHAPDQILMNEHPARALMNKPQSTINQGILGVHSGDLDAFLSAGNTGAVMVGSVMGLGLVQGLSRPAIGALYPHVKGMSLLLDVGANVDCKPEQLVHFALQGQVYMQAVMGVQEPRIALLNIGEERSKGNAAAVAAYELLEKMPNLNFVGNAEGRDMARYVADVYVCDGFVGNILLKYAEAFYGVLKDKASPGDPEVEALNYENIGGLPLLGVKGSIIIGHGSSPASAYVKMIHRAAETVEAQLADRIAKALQQQ